MSSETPRKTYIRVPNRRKRDRLQVLRRVVLGALLSPSYWIMAHRYRTPGLRFRIDCGLLGLRLLCSPKAPVSYADIYRLFFWPMSSTRYFEFAFMWDALSKLSIPRYLDVSSPRLFPIILTLKKHELVADLVNPDAADLTSTSHLVKALNLQSRCNIHACLIGAAPFEPSSFDVVTSMSVVEHIPQDMQAVQKMWELLKPGGRLLLTLPCAAEALEQYINQNAYGLLEPDEQGFVFFQRLYDQDLLEERVFSVAGQPRRRVIYGERTAGAHRRTLDRQLGDPFYPFWREPYMMGQDFCYFKELGELTGEGVIGLEFEKSR